MKDKDADILANVREKMKNAMEALEYKAGESNKKILVVKQKNYDLLCIKAAAFEAICSEMAKEEKNWWEK